jgi:hypothetical protein
LQEMHQSSTSELPITKRLTDEKSKQIIGVCIVIAHIIGLLVFVFTTTRKMDDDDDDSDNSNTEIKNDGITLDALYSRPLSSNSEHIYIEPIDDIYEEID